MSKMKRYLALALLCLCSAIAQAPPAFAADEAASPYNQTSSSVLGVGEAENIGEFIIEWVLKGSSFANPEDTLFGAISFVLNVVALVMASIIITYNGVMYALHTARYGVPGGQKIGGFMTTLRSGVAVTVLMPIVANGFSPIQVLVREVVEGGAYIADQGNLMATRFLVSEGGVTTPPLSGISDVVWQVALNESCRGTFDAYRSMDIGDPPYHIVINKSLSDGVITWSWDYHRDATAILPATEVVAACGSLSITLPSSVGDKAVMGSDGGLMFSDLEESEKPFADIARQQLSALSGLQQGVAKTMDELSAPDLRLVQATGARITQGETSANIEAMYKEASNSAASTIQQMPAISMALAKVDLEYRKAIREVTAAAAKIVHEQDTVRDKDISRGGRTWNEEAEAKGFAGLGVFYWTQMRITQRIHSIQQHLIAPGSSPLLFGSEEAIKENAKGESVLLTFVETEFLQTALIRLKAVKDGYVTVKDNGGEVNLNFNTVDDVGYGNGAGSWLRNNLVNRLGTKAIELISSYILNRQGDLIITFVNMGIAITSTAEILTGTLILLWLAGKAASIFGSVAGGLANFATGAALGKAMPFIVVAILVLAAVGGFFQYILPSIPLIKWIVSLQSWAIMMFMAHIFVPMWAMSHASAAHDGWMPEHARSGYLLLVELLLRPLLMVFGFYAAQMLMVVAGIAVRMATPYLIGLGSEGMIGPVSVVFIILILMVITYRLVVRTFSLVHELPDFLFSRLGMGTSPLGETADGDRHVSTFMGMYSQFQSAPGSRALMSQGASMLGGKGQEPGSGDAGGGGPNITKSLAGAGSEIAGGAGLGAGAEIGAAAGGAGVATTGAGAATGGLSLAAGVAVQQASRFVKE